MHMNMATTRADHGRNNLFQVAIVSILFIFDGVAATDGVNPVPRKMRLVKSLKKHKATIKTIQTEDGDIIDCVDIYKQPAFDHPALVNHTIQMTPSDFTEELVMASNASSPSPSIASSAQLRQLNVGDCPQGTIPILRTRNNDLAMENATKTWVTEDVMFVLQDLMYYFGASGFMNVWDLKDIGPGDMSGGYVVLSTNSTTKDDNSVSAGWEVHQSLYGDQKTRFTIEWRAPGSRNAGCHNLDCPGFVHTNSRLYLGAPFNRTSTFRSFQAEYKVTIYMDTQFNHWWVKYEDTPVGYWPASLFQYFYVAEEVKWVGKVGLTSQIRGCPMGNGHYPSEGLYGVSAYISGALFRGDDNQYYQPRRGKFHFSHKECYEGIGVGMSKFGHPGYSFFYGGNGRRQGCHLKSM